MIRTLNILREKVFVLSMEIRRYNRFNNYSNFFSERIEGRIESIICAPKFHSEPQSSCGDDGGEAEEGEGIDLRLLKWGIGIVSGSKISMFFLADSRARSRLPPLNDGGGKSDKKKLERRGMDSDFQAPVTYPARNALEYMQISPEDLKVTEAMRKLDEEMEKSGYRIPGTSYDTLLRDRLENLNALHGKKSNGVRKSLMEELPSLSPSIFPAELIRGLKLKKKKNAYGLHSLLHKKWITHIRTSDNDGKMTVLYTEEEGSGFMSSDFISHSLAAVGDEEDTQLNKDDERIYDDKASLNTFCNEIKSIKLLCEKEESNLNHYHEIN
eukprot:jgi/Bigna1/83440/fgenesh1_pg.108_\